MTSIAHGAFLGQLGANGELKFQSAREAAGHAGWGAKTKGGTIKVHDDQGRLFKTIEIAADDSGEDGFMLPSL
ncbi:MAG: hypothetical protein QNL33_00715 [Akkermansiaceae bacterium]|jgi:hypothetical protein